MEDSLTFPAPHQQIHPRSLNGGKLLFRVRSGERRAEVLRWLRVHDNGDLELAAGDSYVEHQRKPLLTLEPGSLAQQNTRGLHSALLHYLFAKSHEESSPWDHYYPVQAFSEAGDRTVEGYVGLEHDMGVRTDVMGFRSRVRERDCADVLDGLTDLAFGGKPWLPVDAVPILEPPKPVHRPLDDVLRWQGPTPLRRMLTPVSWHFYEDAPNPAPNRLDDLALVLETACVHRLLHPRYVYDGARRLALTASTDAQAIAEILGMIERGEIETAVDRIGGIGHVLLPDGGEMIQEDLLTLDDFFLGERQLCVALGHNCWTPFDWDEDHLHVWQVPLAKHNWPRLGAFLRELHERLGMIVSPDPEVVDRDCAPFIQWGFNVYVNPEELMDEYLELGALNFSAIAELILRKK